MIFTWERSRNFALICGLVCIAIAAVFMIFGEFYDKTNLIYAAQWIASVGIAITSLGIAAHSIILSKESDKKLIALVKKSDKKMALIANSNFLEIYHNFEDLRIQLTQHPGWLGIEGTIWKCKKYVEWAIELKKLAKKSYQNDLADMYIKLYQVSGVSWINPIVSKTDINHMITMSEDLSKFNINVENKNKLNEIKKDLQKIHNKK